MLSQKVPYFIIGTTGLDVFHWWMQDGTVPGQEELAELAELDGE
jgi:hypothetical protein